MSISTLKPLIGRLRAGAATDDLAVLDALSRLLDRFGDRSIEEMSKALDGLKPKKKAASKAPKAAAPPAAIVETYVVQLRGALGNLAATADVMKRLKADKSVKKTETIAIAAGLGIGATSKTPKAQALTQIEGLSQQIQRDRITAERIRRGA